VPTEQQDIRPLADGRKAHCHDRQIEDFASEPTPKRAVAVCDCCALPAPWERTAGVSASSGQRQDTDAEGDIPAETVDGDHEAGSNGED
jgi:hypothetical protein